ncbi:MAG: MBL fold metallo-hydrolase [Bryobacteraceae bacterium]
MLQLHVVQAEFGDCLLLEYGSASQRFILIDGGPQGIFAAHLKGELQKIAQSGGPLDLAVLSHVDNDHVLGLLDYFADLRTANHQLPIPAELWHNAFTSTIDPNGMILPRLSALVTPGAAHVMAESAIAVDGIAEGNSLRTHALAIGIPINQGFAGGLITVDNAGASRVFDDLTLTIAGPTQTNLDELEQKWIDWLDQHENGIQSGDPFVMANADRSVPNMSSIMFLAESSGRRILLTGDGRSDHLLTGLGAAGLLDGGGKMHVDVLKLPHHGSNRNITKGFFKRVTADIYVASANGKDDNPDLATLIWLVEAARDQNRQVTIAVTNETLSVEKLQEDYPDTDFPYTLRILPAGQSAMVI